MTDSQEWVEQAAAMQGIRLAPGRAEKIAAAMSASMKKADPLRDAVEFEADPTGYLLAIERCKAR